MMQLHGASVSHDYPAKTADVAVDIAKKIDGVRKWILIPLSYMKAALVLLMRE
jgi:hypothetical protein